MAMLRKQIFFTGLLGTLALCVAKNATAGDLKITIPRHSPLTTVQRLNREGVDAVQKNHFDKARELFYKAYLTNEFLTEILNCFTGDIQQHKKITLGDCRKDNRQLTSRNNLDVPDHEPLCLDIMQEHYYPPVMGHPGRAKTLELLQHKSYWPQMRNEVMHYIRNCHTCQCSHASRHAHHGVPRPLAVPDKPWQVISRDFVTGLPSS